MATERTARKQASAAATTTSGRGVKALAGRRTAARQGAKGAPPASGAADVDRHLAALPAGQRAALEKTRAAILAAVPGATELISYRLPTVRLGKPVVAYAAWEQHCSLYLMSYAAAGQFAHELRKFAVSGTTVHFTPGKPLSAALIKKLVRARLKENEAAVSKKQG